MAWSGTGSLSAHAFFAGTPRDPPPACTVPKSSSAQSEVHRAVLLLDCKMGRLGVV